MSFAIKKRNRVPKSCSLCRARKIKCDRSHPTCSKCLSNDTSDLCRYEGLTWAGDLPSSEQSDSVLNDYNSTRKKQKNITDSPYKHAARIPIAFIPSRQSHIANSDEISAPEPKIRSNENYNQPDRLDALHSQITTLSNVVSKLAAALEENNPKNNNTEFQNRISLSPPSSGSSHISSTDHAFTSRTDHIDFYAGHTATLVRKSRVMYHGPLSLFSLIGKDKFLNLCWKFLRGKKEKSKSKMADGKNTTLASTKKEVLPLSHSLEDIMANVREQIRNVLPKKRVIWLLIERFFDSVYPFYPFISKYDFTNAISRIIGEVSYLETPADVNMTERVDFAHVGLLLIVLRLSYLSLINNKTPIEDNAIGVHKYLRANPISFNIVTVAQLCLNQFRILRKADLSTFQLALFMRIYNREAPEYDGNSDTFDLQIFTGLLFQIAFAIGLHEDPVHFEHRESHLRKKMWFFLKQLDVEESISTGVPLRLYNVNSSTQLPDFVNEELGSLEDILENRVIKAMHEDNEITKLLKQLVDYVSSYQPSKVGDVLSTLSSLQSSYCSKYTSLESILTSKIITDDVTRCREIKKYVTCKNIFIKIYYHLMLHYEAIGNYSSATDYLLTILDLNADILANYNFPVTSGEILGCGNEFLYYSFQSTSLISLWFQLSLIMRLDMVATETLDLNMLEKVASIKFLIINNVKALLSAICKFAKTYYTTWRSVSIIIPILRLLEQATIFSKDGDTLYIHNEHQDAETLSKNFLRGVSEHTVLEVLRFMDRDRFQFLLVNKSNFKEGLHHSYDYYDRIANDDTWTRHKQSKTGDRFYANLSNHNISYDGFTDNITNLFNDLIDF